MKVQELLTDPSKWTKEAYARDINGKPVGTKSTEVSCFCLSGAIDRCYQDSANIRLKIHSYLHESIPVWNDAPERTFEDIQQLIKELDI